MNCGGVYSINLLCLNGYRHDLGTLHPELLGAGSQLVQLAEEPGGVWGNLSHLLEEQQEKNNLYKDQVVADDLVDQQVMEDDLVEQQVVVGGSALLKQQVSFY